MNNNDFFVHKNSAAEFAQPPFTLQEEANVHPVRLRNILESPEWIQNKGNIPIPLGQNSTGKPIIIDLTELPHLLIAGTAGSGKTTWENALLLSLLFRFKPSELQLLLIAPKEETFSSYQESPFLLTSVVHEPDAVLQTLHEVVLKIEKRYDMFDNMHVKNIKQYNQLSNDTVLLANRDNKPLPKHLPYVVIIIDEFADLMTANRARRTDTENMITLIAKLGQAAGIHLILATRQLSHDVLTSAIKEAIPFRLALRTNSKSESQIILDKSGAEQLSVPGEILFHSLFVLQNEFLLDIKKQLSAFSRERFVPAMVSSEPPDLLYGIWVSKDEIQNTVTFINNQHEEC